MSKRLYVAAPFKQKETVRFVAGLLEPEYALHARWLDHHYQHEGGILNPQNAAYATLSAEHDLEDAQKADLMVVILEPHSGSHYGWLVEMGIGLACAEEVWLVGPQMNVFCFLNGLQENGCLVRWFTNLDSLIYFTMKEKA